MGLMDGKIRIAVKEVHISRGPQGLREAEQLRKVRHGLPTNDEIGQRLRTL